MPDTGKKIRVAVDARAMEGQRKGIGRYLFSLLDNLEIPDERWKITLLFHREVPANLPRGTYQIKLLSAPYTYIWEQITLPSYLGREKPELFFAPANILPLWLPCPTVLALHDTMMFMPQLSLTKAQRYYTYQAWVLRIMASRCRSIITVSQFSAQEILRYLGAGLGATLRVIAEGVEERFFATPTATEMDAFLKKHGLGRGYILHFASAVPRKNTYTALQALALLKSRGIELPRIFLPGLGANEMVVQKWLTELGLTAITASYLSEEELPLAYAGAGLLLYPSQWEGFGLPLLEGMAAGLPVIASNATSIPELAGDCAWLVPPWDATELALTLERWLENPGRGRELGERARKRAGTFQWQSTARNVFQTWHDALHLD